MSGDGEAGLSSFEEGLRLAPRSPTLWKNAAVCLAGMGRREEASAAAARAVRLNRGLREELAPLLP
jgi:Flp pilus assembly protein TadD